MTIKYDYKFYIGCNDKYIKQDNSKHVIKNVQNYFLKMFGFYTMQVAQGAYTHNDNTIVTEKMCIVELVLDNKLLDIELICATLKESCNQESILVTVSRINGDLY